MTANTRELAGRCRAFSHKVKTGCTTCRKRHVKCDEAKPSCLKCRKRGLSCTYEGPKAWVFEPSRNKKALQPARHDQTISSDQPVYDSLGEQWGTAEERALFHFWVRSTGPWLANYCPGKAGRAWFYAIPRLAITLPGLKHLMVATAMMEQPLHTITPQSLTRRSQRISYHYIQAIQILSKYQTINLDTIAASLMAWVFETMSKNIKGAKMHLEASQRLFEEAIVNGFPNDSSEEYDILFNYLREAQLACSAFLSTEASLRLELEQVSTPEPMPDIIRETYEGGSVFAELIARHGPSTIRSSREAALVFEKYVNNFERIEDTSISIPEAVHFLSHWETCVLNGARKSNEPAVNFVAVHLLLRTGKVLLSSRTSTLHDNSNSLQSTDASEYFSVSGCQIPNPVDSQSLDYILDKFSDFVAIEHPKREDQVNLEATLELGFRTIHRFAREWRHREQATQLLSELQFKGKMRLDTFSFDTKKTRENSTISTSTDGGGVGGAGLLAFHERSILASAG